MWSNKIVLRVVALLVCSLSLSGCWQGRKTHTRANASTLYDTRKAEPLQGKDGLHVSDMRIASEQTIYYFRLNSDALDAHAKSLLDNTAQQLKKHSEANIVLDGHADARGPDSFNERLSQKRADSVKSYLMYQGIDANRIETYSHSNHQLAVTGNSDTAHAKNRRVELKFVD